MTEDKIKKLCKKYNIENYTINDDMSIDVNGNVDLSFEFFYELPITFKGVIGSFTCSHSRLTTLKGCPTHVGRSFDCRNTRITSLDYSPKYVGGGFYCHANKITSLKGAPNYVGDWFYCGMKNLSSLEYLPKQIKRGLGDSGENNTNYRFIFPIIEGIGKDAYKPVIL